jgi:hypothetical protein
LWLKKTGLNAKEVDEEEKTAWYLIIPEGYIVDILKNLGKLQVVNISTKS